MLGYQCFNSIVILIMQGRNKMTTMCPNKVLAKNYKNPMINHSSKVFFIMKKKINPKRSQFKVHSGRKVQK